VRRARTGATPAGSCLLSHTYVKSSCLYVAALFTLLAVIVFPPLIFFFPLAHNSSLFPVPFHIISSQKFISFFVTFYLLSLCHIDSISSQFFILLLYVILIFLVWQLFSYSSFLIHRRRRRRHLQRPTPLLSLGFFFRKQNLVLLRDLFLHRQEN
jgi:uncharacterized protein (DUF58 family)